VTVVAGVFLALLLPAQAAEAHALLVQSDPASGAILAESPPLAHLWFSEEIEPRLSSVQLLDREGHDVPGAHVAQADDPRLLEVQLPELGSGTYGIVWNVLASDDGHRTNGVVVFSVGAQVPTTLDAGNAGSSGESNLVLRWLALLALVGTVGGLAVAFLVIGRVEGRDLDPSSLSLLESVRRRILLLAGGCASVGALVGLFAGFENVNRLATPGTATFDVLFGTRWGVLWLIHESALIALVLLALQLRRLSVWSSSWSLRALVATSGVAVAALVWVEALGSHASAVEPARWSAVLGDAAHVLAACTWVGALPLLLLLLWPRFTAHNERTLLIRACRARFSGLVAASVGLLLMSGLYSAGREVRSVADLWGTSYGRILLLKSALLVGMGLIGLVNSSRLHGRLVGWRDGSDRATATKPLDSRLVVAEAGIGATVLVAVALLVATPPPTDEAAATAGPVSVQRRTSAVDDLVVTIAATPNRPGENWFTVVTASSRRPPPAPIDRVDLALAGSTGAQQITLRHIGSDTYFGVGRLAGPGRFSLNVVIHRDGTRLPLRVTWPVRPVSASPVDPGQPLAPITNALALAVFAVFCAGALTWATARRRSSRRSRSSAGADDQPLPEHAVDDRQLTPD
jgi:copper transport protein